MKNFIYVIIAKTAAEQKALLDVIAAGHIAAKIEYDGKTIYAYVPAAELATWHQAAFDVAGDAAGGTGWKAASTILHRVAVAYGRAQADAA